ncbi:MAG TPA: neuraminidase-like domain-containing protein, partial [Roseiflexaceae bacterium]
AATSAPDQGFWRPQRQVIRFGDVDSLVEYVDPGSRTERQRRTVEVWFQVEDKTISHRKQVIYQEGDDQRGLNLYVYDSWLYFGGYNLPAGESGWAGTWLRTDRIDSGVWHHAAIVLDGRAELRDESLIAYLDGKLADVGPGSQLWQHKNDLSLGGVGGAVRFHDGESNDGPGHFLDGRIMELRVWNTARTTAQIGEFWSRTLGAQRANLALWWDFDQAAAAQIGDASGNGHAAAIGANQLEQLRVSLEENPAYALHPAPLNAQILDGIARIKLLKERHGLSIDRLTALWYGIKHTGRDDGATLFDQIFNPKGVIADRWEPYIDRPIRWDKTGQGDQGTTRESDRQIRSRLMGAARVSAADLNAIVEHLSGKDEIIIDLDGAYLGRVYQLAQLARSVQLSVQDFFRLLALLGERSVDAAGDLVALSDRVEWMRQAGLAVADLERLTAKILADEEVAGIVAAAQAAIEAANAARAAAAAAAAAAADNQSDQAAARALQEATRLADVADLAAAGVPVDLQRTVAQAARFARDAAGWTQRAVDAAQDAAARDAAAAALNAADLAWGAATRALIAAEQAEHSFSAFYSEPGARTLARNLAGQAQGFLLNETAFKSDNVKAEHSPDIFAFLSGGTITQSDGTPIATGPTFIDANGAVTPQYDESADLHDLLAALAAKHALLPEALRVAVAPIQQGLGKAVADAAAAAAAAVQAAAKARTDSAKAKAAEDAKAAATQKKLDEVIRRLQDGQRFAAGGQPRPIVDASKLVIVDLDTLRQIDLKALFDAGTTPDKAVLAGIEQALESTRISQDDLRTRVHEVLRQARSALADAIMAGLTELFGIQPKQPGLIDAVVSHFQSDAHMDSVRFYAHMLAILDPAADIPRALAIYLAKLGKALAIATAFDLSAAEAQALLRTPGLLGIGDILQPTIANLESLLRFKELKTAFGDDAGRLVTLLQQTVDTEISRQILALTGWEGRQLARAQSYFGAALAYNRVEVLDRLKQCFDLARSLALEVDFLIQLASPDDLATARELGFYTEQAAALLKVLRARYTDEEWPKVLDPIRSQLAVQKRDALLALALLKLGPDFAGRKDPDILYEYFLLDMQVGSEVLTSRIVQATASVQLYVQRCLMNLERGVSPDTIPAQEWEWVKNYRVWEANRKVFLYPENYIEPELRASKSPLFEELEQELMQNDINQESVVKAYTSYLDKFREVANLRIVGSYLHSDRAHNPDGDEVLYLIGRTKTDPWVYYYRTLVNGTQWTPWQKIELTINAEFVTPVFAFNKLFLFWIEFAKKTKSVDRRYDPAKDLDDIKAGRKILGPNNTVINVRTNTAEQENINVYDTVVKFSYYNFSKSWVQPQMYLDLKNELKEDEYILPLWQRVYAQRSLVSFDQTVLEVSQPTSLSKNIPATFNMKGLTWSWWVRLQNAIPGGSIDKIDRTLTLFTYGDAASGMASALVTSNPTRIAGAPDVAALKTARDTAESEMKKAKDEMDAAWSYYNRLTSGGGAPQKRKKAKAKEDYDKKKATYDQKKATYDQAKAAYDAALTRLQWESKNPVLRFSIGDQSASLDLAYGVWQHVAVTTSYQNNQYQVSFYLDGVLKGAPALLTASALVAGKSLAIGQADTAGVETAFKAQMAEFQLWNSVRSATVINAQKDQRQSGDPANLFYLRLNAPEPGATMSLIARSDLSLRPPIQQEIAKVLRVSASAFVPAFVPQFNTDQLTVSFWVKFVSHYPVLPGQIQSNVDAAHLNIDTYIEGLRKSLTLFTFGDGPTATVKSSLTRLSPDIRDLKRARDDAQTNLTSANTAVTLASGVVSTAAQDAMDHPDDQSKKDALAKARSDYAAAQEDQKNKQTAYDNANRAYTAALAAPQWESKSLTLQFALGKDQKQTAAIDLAYGSWQHVALTMTYAGSGYTLQWYLNGERQGQPVSLTAGRLDLGSLLSIGQPDVSAAGVETAFTAQMSEFELWDRARDAATIKAEMRRRPSNRQWGLLRLPLDAIPSLQILFMTVVSFGTIEDSDLIFELPLPPVVPVKERERVLIFYGNVIRSLRQNNEEDQSFDLSLLSPDGNVKSYDVDLSRSTLYLTSTTGLSLNDYATQQGSTTQLATKRLNATTLQSYIDIIRADPNHPFRNQLEAAVQVAPSADMQLIKKLTRLEASVADVNNQPGWYIVNTGDEQFLVKATAQALKTIEERLRFEYKPDPNRLEIEPQASGIYFDRDPAFEPGGASNPPFKFEFVRLSTVAVHQLSLRLFEGGLDELLSLESQRAEEVHFAEYDPNSALVVPPNYDATTQTIAAGIDFEGAYGLYYQEIFFHIPFLIANRLNANQNFADAQRWYHYIFNPTAREEGEGNAGDRYWRYLAFRNLGPETLVRMLSNPAALKEYHEDPFDPHAIARLRVHAYQKAIVMKYIDNLLDWGDYLFTQDSRESINEATMLYVLAFNLLGPRPKGKTVRRFEQIGTYDQVRAKYGDNGIPDFLADVVPAAPAANGSIGLSPHSNIITDFCVLENEKFVGYWDRVEDRLFKIRHSLNIEGIFRQLALFQPPIEPAALVAAVAGGRGIAGALADLSVPAPHYRYAFVLEKAKDMVS